MQQRDESLESRPLPELLKPTWEKAAYAVLFLVAVVSRFWNLGAYSMSHDESLHSLYSYYLYSGSGYVHNPMMHGPFLYHLHTLGYVLFGDTDFSARIMPALFGVITVFTPLLLRRWLGRAGTLLASVGLLISPIILFYSRMVWMDIYVVVFTMLMVAALFHLLHDHRPRWLYLGAAALVLSMATKELAYMFGFIGLVFIVAALLWEQVGRWGQLWLFSGGLAFSALLLLAGWQLDAAAGRAAEAAAAAARAGAEVVEGAGKALELIGSLCTVIGAISLVATLSAILIPSCRPRLSRFIQALRHLGWQPWLLVALGMVLTYVLLFTTFFTNLPGLGTGIVGSVGYWLAQHDVQRGGQPWYYYLLLLAMYEFLPFLLGAVASVYYLVRRLVHLIAGEPGQPASEAQEPGGGTQSPGYQEQSVFAGFLVFWSIATIILYSWAGEKMPWLGVHLALPLILLSAQFLGDTLGRVDWRAAWNRGAGWLALLLPLTLLGLYTLARVRPFQGLSLPKLQETGNWIAALLVTLALVALTMWAAWRLRARHSLAVGAGILVAGLALLTVRFAWMAAYKNRDMATEMLVYAHGTPDVALTMNEVADISRRTVGDKMIEVAYDNEVTWPLEWYLREYPNRKYFADTPSRDKLNTPVILYSERNEDKVKPYLADRYTCVRRRLVWWPSQQYFGLTLKRSWEILRSAESRKALWDILYWRKYPQTPANWYHVHNFQFCVRKDVAQQLWDFGSVPPAAVEAVVDPYLEAHVDVGTLRTWGTTGEAPGEFNRPRGIDIGPDGNVYVVDSDNFRVQVFDPTGALLREWGGHCNLADGQGCTDPDGYGPLELGDGQFQEPWGIAVGADWRVYVADTWNHRIQVFDTDGTFVTKWGSLGQTDSLVNVLYGPRDVALDASGRVFVSDTGNKRVLVYDAEGNLLDQVGGAGALPGQFEEPVGIDLDSQGNLYVADVWNQRIQAFDSGLGFLREWAVDAWFGQSVVNKPFLALDSEDRVYVSDPEGYQVIVFTVDGQLQAVFGEYGYDATSFSLPTGIALDRTGTIYVTDTGGQRVMAFEPLR